MKKTLGVKMGRGMDRITIVEVLKTEMKPLSGICNRLSVNLTPVSRQSRKIFFLFHRKKIMNVRILNVRILHLCRRK